MARRSNKYKGCPYYMCISKSVGELVIEVHELIANGFVPLGSPFVNEGIFYQAMYKHDEVE